MVLSTIDATLLKPNVTKDDITKLCRDCEFHKLRGVCIAPSNVKKAFSWLNATTFKISSVIGFPLGNTTTYSKVEEAKEAIDNGADELDTVWNLGLYKSGFKFQVLRELLKIVEIDNSVKVKVIVESTFLNDDELTEAYEIVRDSGAKYIKTSTGFFPLLDGLPDFNAIYHWKSLGDLKIKASGGFSNLTLTKKALEAGASVVGTSSYLKIAEELSNE